MINNTKFGIYTSFYKCKEFVETAFNNIESIKYEDFEWHVTDDFSDDGTKEVLIERLDKSPIKHKIKYYDQTEKKEMYWAPNKFFDDTFDWIVLVDADDLIDPNSLSLYDRMIASDTVLISSKIERYHPEVDYLENLSYSCFGHLRAFKNLPDIKFEVDNVNAGAEDSYHIFWCNSYGRYLHIPRPTYHWLLRGDSESHSGNFGSHFNDNFEGALNKLKYSDPGVDKRFNHLYKETCALGSYGIGEITGKEVSLYTRNLHTDDIELLRNLYFDTLLKINGEDSNINIIVTNYYSSNELECLLLSISGEVLLYYQEDRKYKDNESMDIQIGREMDRLRMIGGKYFGIYNYFFYIRHLIIKGDLKR